jgi:hypothetical protein
MQHYPIVLNLKTDWPIGFLELHDDIVEEFIKDGAVVPLLDAEFKIICFGLVPRTQVSTTMQAI